MRVFITTPQSLVFSHFVCRAFLEMIASYEHPIVTQELRPATEYTIISSHTIPKKHRLNSKLLSNS